MGAPLVQRYNENTVLFLEEHRVSAETRGPLSVLLVDDSAEFLEAAGSWLATQRSLRLVGTARDGTEALAWLERAEVDLVLVDCFMPGMDGFEATRRIKSAEGAPLVVMLSVHEGSTMEKEAWAAGADGFVAKSDFAGRLPELIRGLVAASGAGHALRPVPRPPEDRIERSSVDSGVFRWVLDGFSARLRNVGNDRRARVGAVLSLTEGGNA